MTPGYVLIALNGVSGPAAGHWYYIHLAAPPGQNLAVGTYLGATRAAFRAAGEPGIDIYGDGTGCNEVNGQFTVNEIAFTGPLLTTFSASYSFTCPGSTAHAAGEVRIASSEGFAGLRQLPADPGALDFGASNIVGVPSAPKATQLINMGTTSVAIGSFGIGGTNASDYAQSAQTCGSTLAPGASCGWNTTFTPTADGYRYGVAHFTSDTHGFIHGQTTSGFAGLAFPQLQVLPADGKAFGTITLGASASQAFTITTIGNVTTRSAHAPSPAPMRPNSRYHGRRLPGTASGRRDVHRDRELPAGQRRTEDRLAVDPRPWRVLPIPASAERDGGPSSERGCLGHAPEAWSVLHLDRRRGIGSDGPIREPAPAPCLCHGPDRRRLGEECGASRGHLLRAKHVRHDLVDPERINPRTQHATRSALAASGARVYVAWVSQTKIVRYSPSAAGPVYPGQHEAWRLHSLAFDGPSHLDDGTCRLPERRRVGDRRHRQLDGQRHRKRQGRHLP